MELLKNGSPTMYVMCNNARSSNMMCTSGGAIKMRAINHYGCHQLVVVAAVLKPMRRRNKDDQSGSLFLPAVDAPRSQVRKFYVCDDWGAVNYNQILTSLGRRLMELLPNNGRSRLTQ